MQTNPEINGPGAPPAAVTRPRVGISACLAGFAVRYDGRDRRSATCMEQLSRSLDWLPLCPEVAVGLGTPRPTIDLHRQHDDIVAFNRNHRSLNPSRALRAFAEDVSSRFPRLNGYVFMSRSPSCALHSGRLYQDGELVSTAAAGLFAQRWRELNPKTPVVEYEDLEDPHQRLRFLVRCYLSHGRHLIEQAHPAQREQYEEIFRPLAGRLAGLVIDTPKEPEKTLALMTELLVSEWLEPHSLKALASAIEALSRNANTGCSAMCRQLLASVRHD